MDPFTPRLLAEGLKACMGKGNRGPEVQEALKQYRAVYFMAVGGAGAMLSQFIRKVEVVAYEDLGTESLKRVEVEDFPAVVMDDCEGRDLLNEGRKQWRDLSKLGSYKPSERIVVAGG
jgi:fumarate hydratase subunit beta